MVFFVITVTVFWRFTVGLVVLVLWLIDIAANSTRLARGLSTAVHADRAVVSCKHGHRTSTAGGMYQCQGCNFIYEGSVWLCENPECRGVTPFIECGTCGVSVRNPYRIG